MASFGGCASKEDASVDGPIGGDFSGQIVGTIGGTVNTLLDGALGGTVDGLLNGGERGSRARWTAFSTASCRPGSAG